MKTIYKNILIHNMVNLGDVVSSTACLPILRKAFPDAHITFMTRPKISDVLQNNPYIDEVMEYSYVSKSDKLSIFKQANILRQRKFDLSISLDRRPRMSIITWLAGIPERIGPNKIFYEKSSLCTKLYTKIIYLPYLLNTRHQSYLYQDIIGRFTGLSEFTGNFTPYISEAPQENQKNAANIWNSTGKKAKIVLCIRAEFALKNWLPERWMEIIKIINQKYNAGMIIVGVAGDFDYVQDIINQSGVNVLNLCGKTSMLDLVALYEQCDLGIVIDNGSAHIAGALDTKLVAIFGCSLPQRAIPKSSICECLFLDLDCVSSCKIPCLGHECMSGITVEMVMQKVDKVWKMI